MRCEYAGRELAVVHRCIGLKAVPCKSLASASKDRSRSLKLVQIATRCECIGLVGLPELNELAGLCSASWARLGWAGLAGLVLLAVLAGLTQLAELTWLGGLAGLGR